MPDVNLDVTDAGELADMLQFLSQWLAGDPARLDASLEQFVRHPAYGISQLRADLERFVFLLGGKRRRAPVRAATAIAARTASAAGANAGCSWGMICSVRHDGPQVAELVAPRWRPGTRTTETVVPSPRDVEQAVRHLDGNEYNDLYLRTSDAGTFLGIGGGAGRYMVAICKHGERFGQLLNTHDPSDVRERIMCGGQQTGFPRRHLVDLQTALTAAAHYLATAQAAPTLSWEWHS